MAYDAIFQHAGETFNVDPALLKLVMGGESAGDPNAISPKGAQGLMQLMPDTANDMGVTNVKDPVQNIYGGAKYLGMQLDKYGNVPVALAAYNAGPGAVDQHGGKIPPYPETQKYIAGIMNQYGGAPAKAAASRMPGLPPLADSADPANNGGAVDPFGGLSGPSGASAAPSAQPAPQNAASGPVDPFAGLSVGPPNPGGGSSVIPGTPIKPAAPAGPEVSRSQAFGQGMLDTGLGAVQGAVHASQALPKTGGILENMPLFGPAMKMLNMAPAAQMDQRIAAQNKGYEDQRKAAGQDGIDWYRGAGNAVSQLPLALASPETAGLGTLAKWGIGTGMGAASGLMAPVTDTSQPYWSEKLKQAGVGALGGAIATPIAYGIGNVLQGAGGAAQRMLRDAGVTMTPGQILGGAWKATEDKLTSVPVLGDLIRNAQRRSVQDFNNATYNQVLEPIGQRYSGPAGADGVAHVENAIGNVYDSTLPRMSFNARDPQFVGDITHLWQMAQSLPESQRETFTNIFRNQIFDKLSPNGHMTGETLKGAQSELRRQSAGYAGGNQSWDNQQLGHALGELKNAIDGSLLRNNAPEDVAALANANSAWARYVRLRTAASSQGAMNNNGVITPAQLTNAVRAKDQSVGKGAVARGDALMQDWAVPAQEVLGQKYPDSGTPGRHAIQMAVGALAGHQFLPEGVKAATIPLAAASTMAMAPYTPIGQRIAQSVLMARSPGVRALGAGISRYGGAAAGPLGAAALLNGPDR